MLYRHGIKLLSIVLDHAEDNVTMHIETILSTLYRVVSDDEIDIAKTVCYAMFEPLPSPSLNMRCVVSFKLQNITNNTKQCCATPDHTRQTDPCAGCGCE